MDLSSLFTTINWLCICSFSIIVMLQVTNTQIYIQVNFLFLMHINRCDLHIQCDYDHAFPIKLKNTDLCWRPTVTAEIINTNKASPKHTHCLCSHISIRKINYQQPWWSSEMLSNYRPSPKQYLFLISHFSLFRWLTTKMSL